MKSECFKNLHLTKRQKEVLKLACLSNDEIARRLSLAKSTVATHFETMRDILCVSSKSALLIEGIRRREISIDEVETL